jgi:hypothetical protein
MKSPLNGAFLLNTSLGTNQEIENEKSDSQSQVR